MIELKRIFSRSFGEFKQITKDDTLVVYQLIQTHKDAPASSSYEVFKHRVKKPNNFINDFYEEYPPSEFFGVSAWSCSDAGCVAKVITREFPEHPLSKMMEKFIVGTYKSGGIERNRYELTHEQLIECINSLRS